MSNKNNREYMHTVMTTMSGDLKQAHGLPVIQNDRIVGFVDQCSETENGRTVVVLKVEEGLFHLLEDMQEANVGVKLEANGYCKAEDKVGNVINKASLTSVSFVGVPSENGRRGNGIIKRGEVL